MRRSISASDMAQFRLVASDNRVLAKVDRVLMSINHQGQWCAAKKYIELSMNHVKLAPSLFYLNNLLNVCRSEIEGVVAAQADDALVAEKATFDRMSRPPKFSNVAVNSAFTRAGLYRK